jgi:hypothetical protein
MFGSLCQWNALYIVGEGTAFHVDAAPEINGEHSGN